MKLRSSATRSSYERPQRAVPRWAAISASARSLITAGQPGVVEMVVGDEHELDVLQGVPERCQLLLERGEGLVVRGAGVDERQRLAGEQPDVDRAEVRHRHRDLRDFTHTGTERLTAPSAESDSLDDFSSGLSSSPWRASQLPQQRSASHSRGVCAPRASRGACRGDARQALPALRGRELGRTRRPCARRGAPPTG